MTHPNDAIYHQDQLKTYKIKNRVYIGLMVYFLSFSATLLFLPISVFSLLFDNILFWPQGVYASLMSQIHFVRNTGLLWVLVNLLPFLVVFYHFHKNRKKIKNIGKPATGLIMQKARS